MFRPLLALLGLCCAGFAAGAAPLEREIVLAKHGGDAAEDLEIRRWQERVSAEGADADAYLRLGWAFVAKGRRTLDDGYFKLGEMTAGLMAEKFGANPHLRLLRGHVLHMLHRFKEAESEARRLVAERGAAEDFGLLSDALMEQGRLDDAVAALQRMVDLKPGAEAFCRISHLRWLKGDEFGARSAMKEALRATSPRDREKRAWLLVRASTLALQKGDVAEAWTFAKTADEILPDYAPALFTLGRIEVAGGKPREALEFLRRAVAITRLPEYQWWLADVLRAAGNAGEAATVEAELFRRGEAADPRTLALFLATREVNTALALRLARAELEQRADVFTRDALAWALMKRCEITAAEEQMRAALAEGTKDARLFFHAGEIAWARHELDAAAKFFAQARAMAFSLTPSERAQLDARLARLDLATLTAAREPPLFFPQ